MGFEMARLSRRDAGNLAAFLREVDGDFPVRLSSKVDLDAYARKLLDEGAAFFCFVDGVTCGAIAGYMNDEATKTAYVSVIATSSHARGRGIGLKLLREFESEASRRGMRAVELETHRTNSAALGLYRREGFSELKSLSSGDVRMGKRMAWLTPERPNVLLTSAGRRSYLVDWFKEALGGAGEVHAANSSPQSPALLAADRAVVTPLIYSNGYIPFLLDYCRDNGIGALVPLFDVDVPVLAARRGDFLEAGCFPVVCPPETAAVCNDKLATARFLEGLGLAAPRTYTSVDACRAALSAGEIAWPMVVKPRWGMGSIGVFAAHDEPELRALASMVAREAGETYLRYESAADPGRCVLFQGRLSGQEWGMDVMCDLSGNLRGVSARRKVAMRAGETDCAEVVETPPELEALARKLAAATRHPGNMDVDVFMTDEGPVVLEMNARFGGGYPFSHAAGVDLPRALVAWLRGDASFAEGLSVGLPGVYQKDMRIVRLDGGAK